VAWRPNAEKDPNLLAKLITAVCPPNGRVLDLCAGTGSSALAALMTGRSWTGCENEGRLASVAKDRIYLFFSRLQQKDPAHFSVDNFNYAEFLKQYPNFFVRRSSPTQQADVYYLGLMSNSPVSSSSVGRMCLQQHIEKEKWPIEKKTSSVGGYSDQEMGLFAHEQGELQPGTVVGCAWGQFASRSSRGTDIRLELPTEKDEEPPPDIILSEDSPGYWFNDARNTGCSANCEIQVGDRSQWRVASRHRWIKIFVCFFLSCFVSIVVSIVSVWLSLCLLRMFGFVSSVHLRSHYPVVFLLWFLCTDKGDCPTRRRALD
jgi:hypothetical protein